MDKLFTLTYFPYRPDAQPHTALEEAILEVDEDGFMPCPKFDSEEACPF